MLKLGLIGSGISRTQVHQLHILLGDLHGLTVRYDLMDIPHGTAFDLQSQLSQCEREGYSGVNITHPYKLKAYSCVTDHSGLPQGLESVNTVLFRKGSWQGGNTDYSGFAAAYRARFGNIAPGRVLMVGAGGVGISIAFALANLGAESIVIHDLDSARAVDLAERVRGLGPASHPVLGGALELEAEAREADGLVNATPVGMHQYPGNVLPEGSFGSARWAFDAIYSPPETDFLRQARSGNATVMGGFELFLHQGLDAFECFSGEQVDRKRAIAMYMARYPQEPAGASSQLPCGP